MRHLWGRGSGSFRTGSKRSAATVRGTWWLVEDRCDGTVTRVKTGRVDVRDFRLKKTIRLRAGKRSLYLAKAPERRRRGIRGAQSVRPRKRAVARATAPMVQKVRPA